MQELVMYDKPVDRVRHFILSYAKQLYGIENASALMPLVEIAFAPTGVNNSERIAAARELLKYSEVPTRSVEYQGGGIGPDLEVTIIGTCAIREPVIHGYKDPDTEQVVSTKSSGALVELPHAGREEGS